MKSKSLMLIGLAAACLPLAPLPASAEAFVDVLKTPAMTSPLASRGLLQAVTRAGDRLVAVGFRGHIVYSTDAGKNWVQAKVPVTSDLTAVYFANDKKGWAVGHDGVVLATANGGESWELQLDGMKANEILMAAMEKRAAAEPASADAKAMVAEAARYVEQGADKPFLDVWFENENTGYVVGAYNLIYRTGDGGKTWEALFDRTDNPKFMNLYAIRPGTDGLYIAGEAGTVLRLDTATQRFKAIPTPYKGSYFGIASGKSSVLVFGLRGTAYRTENGGKTWDKVDAGLSGTIVGGVTNAKGTVFLADVGGRLVASFDDGKTFIPVPLKDAPPLAGIADAGEGRLALAGPRGVAVAEIAAK